MKTDTPHILFVNPWIHDFAAYDFWAKPLGLLILAAILRRQGIHVSYIDCLDRFHPKAPGTNPNARHGRGPYLKSRIKKPVGLEDVPRNYSRYGILPDWFREDLSSLRRPDLICVTSQMTYWYPGVQETIGIIKETFPETKVILGGIYATLCREHAVKHAGADQVVSGPGETYLLKTISEETGFAMQPMFVADDLNSYPYPAFDLQRKTSCLPLLTSKGCPFSCAYCASHILQPKRILKDPEATVEEIKYWYSSYGVKDFVFYDDALLVDRDTHAIPMLEQIINSRLDIRFHTPNAIHISGITRKTACLMYQAGFKTLRLGLETASFDKRKKLDSKVTAQQFQKAVVFLREAGFKKDQIGAYLLVGLPGQSTHSVSQSIQTVKQSGITPVPAYYSPIPKTQLWERAKAISRYNLEHDPVFSNNAIFPCQREAFTWETVSLLKNQVAL